MMTGFIFRIPELNSQVPPQSPPNVPPHLHQKSPTLSTSLPKPKILARKASFEGVVKQLADLTVGISADEVSKGSSDLEQQRVLDVNQLAAVCLWKEIYLTMVQCVVLLG